MNKLNIIKLVHSLRTADCAGVTVIINQVCNIFTTYKSFKRLEGWPLFISFI